MKSGHLAGGVDAWGSIDSTIYLPTRLLTQLDRLLDGRVAVIASTPGYGGLELVTRWLDSRPSLARACLSKELSDADLDALVTRHGPGATVVAVVCRQELINNQGFGRRLLAACRRHATLRVVFCGRSRPDIPLGALAVAGQLVDLTTQDLAFTLDEITEALRVNTPEIGVEHLSTVHTESAGWPMAIWLFAAEHLTWSATQRLTTLMENFITSDVLSLLSDEDRTLLRELSVLESVDASAAPFVAECPDAVARLLRLQSEGMPLRWDEDNQASLPPVMRRVLHAELVSLSPERAATLNARAVMWLRSRGRPLQAINRATLSGDKDLAWKLSGEYILTHIYDPGFASQLEGLLAALPPSSSPWAEVIRGAITVVTMPELMPVDVGRRMAEGLMGSGARGPLARVVMTLANARMHAYQTSLDLTVEIDIAAAMASRVTDRVDRLLLGLAEVEIGCYYASTGELDKAVDYLSRGASQVRLSNAWWSVVLALSSLALTQAMRGQATVALKCADEALRLAEEHGFADTILDEEAILAQLLVAIDVGDHDHMSALMDRLETRHGATPAAVDIKRHLLALVDLYLGDPRAALRRVSTWTPEPDATDVSITHCSLVVFDATMTLGRPQDARQALERIPSRFARDACVLNRLARLMIIERDYEEAWDLLHEQPTTNIFGPRSELNRLMLLSNASQHLGHAAEAIEANQQAIRLATELGLNHPDARFHALDGHQSPVALTPAERHVLANLDVTVSLAETAAELFISVNTLKTHLRRIYRKLGVTNREQAIQRASMLGNR